MTSKLFVANIQWEINNDALGQIFTKSGKVVSAKIVLNRDTGRSRGFGFVEMSTPEEAKKAIKDLNGKDVKGRILVVDLEKLKKSESKLTVPSVPPEESDFMQKIRAFVEDEAGIGVELGFESGGKHFTIRRDE